MTAFASLLASANPGFEPAWAETVAAERWEIVASADAIASTQDQNFRLRSPDGTRFVLKVANRQWSQPELTIQNAAMEHLAGRDLGFAVPQPVPAANGARIVEIDGHHVRLLSWVDGTPLAEAGALGPHAWRGLGEIAARCDLALRDFEHEALERPLQWDPRYARELVQAVGGELRDPAQVALLKAALVLMEALPDPDDERLPRQPVHCDVTDYNVVGRVEGGRGFVPDGLVDFGDVVRTWRVAEPAHAAMSAVFHDLDDPLGGVLAVTAGYHTRFRLEEIECDVLWAVVVARAVVCALSSTHQASVAGELPHLIRLMAEDWAALGALLAVPAALAVAAVRAACGFPPAPSVARLAQALAAQKPVSPVVADGPLVPVDLSIASERFAFGEWKGAAGVAAAAAAKGLAVGRWGELRLTQSGRPATRPPAVLHLGADLFASAGTAVVAPLGGRVTHVDDGGLVLTLSAGNGELALRLAGLHPTVARGAIVARGADVGVVSRGTEELPAHLHVQLAAAPDLPGLGRVRERDALLAVCPDPSVLLGVEVAAPSAGTTPAAERARRSRVVAPVQDLYYRTPIEMVRGWRHHLYDSEGRPYVDAVNNVALLGHSHPRVAEAASRALRRLNTNSRFLYAESAAFAERLTATFPSGLNSVLFVNSGSEAVDLALRLARAATGRHDVLAIAGAYHGWTTGTFDICTHPADRPDGAASVPPYVHVVDQPDPYRGRHGADPAGYVDSVKAACAAAPPAALITEALLGAQGGITPPRGYLAQAYATVRAAGGLCIADEVQVGYGRTGTHMWAFEHERVVPDIVCMAKGAGNGYPLGAVVCRPEVAASLGPAGSFFSSPAGSPLSCAIGSTVLDVLAEEELQQNAHVVGMQLRAELDVLAERHEAIGAVHGRGLYLGVDLVRDPDTRTPDPVGATMVCERLRELGAIVQPTGDHSNVLKFKPPLCFDTEAVEHVVTALDRALGEGLAGS